MSRFPPENYRKIVVKFSLQIVPLARLVIAYFDNVQINWHSIQTGNKWNKNEFP